MALNIKTGYPILKGDMNLQFASMQNQFVSLLDELQYLIPQLEAKIDSVKIPLSSDSSGETE